MKAMKSMKVQEEVKLRSHLDEESLDGYALSRRMGRSGGASQASSMELRECFLSMQVGGNFRSGT